MARKASDLYGNVMEGADMTMVSSPLQPRVGSLLTVTRREAFQTTGSLWSDDIIELDVAGDPAGYMVLSHVPRERIKREMPLGIVDFIRTIKGNVHLKVPPEELPEALRRHVGLPVGSSGQRVKAAINSRYGSSYTDFLDFHVDKPFVAYVRLYSECDAEIGHHSLASSLRSEPRLSYRNLGLGSVLYQQAAIWLLDRGFLLHADDNQTDEAKAVWPRLDRQFPGAVVPEAYNPSKPGAIRCRLDGTKVGDVWLPEWAGGLRVTERIPQTLARGEMATGAWKCVG